MVSSLIPLKASPQRTWQSLPSERDSTVTNSLSRWLPLAVLVAVMTLMMLALMVLVLVLP